MRKNATPSLSTSSVGDSYYAGTLSCFSFSYSGDAYNGDDTPLAYMRFLFFAMFAGTAVTVMSGERR